MERRRYSSAKSPAVKRLEKSVYLYTSANKANQDMQDIDMMKKQRIGESRTLARTLYPPLTPLERPSTFLDNLEGKLVSDSPSGSS